MDVVFLSVPWRLFDESDSIFRFREGVLNAPCALAALNIIATRRG